MIHLPKIKILTAAIALSMGIYNANAQAIFKTTGAKIGITTGANIHVQGSVISETASTSEGEFYDNGHLSLEGNWTNNNSTGNGFEAASQVTVEFNGSVDQHIDGSKVTEFPKVKVNNGGGNVVLGQETEIKTDLNFASGKLQVGNYDLIISAAAAITGFGGSNYVITNSMGRLVKELNTLPGSALDFPVGDDVNYTPLTFTLTDADFTTDNYLAIRVANSKDPNITAPSIITFLNRYWQVTSDIAENQSLIYDVSYQYSDVDVTGDEATIRASKTNSQGLELFDHAEVTTNTLMVSNQSSFGNYSGVGQFADLAGGTFTIGGISPDYNTISEAVNSLKYYNLTGSFTFNIRDGIYNESIDLGKSNIFTIGAPDVFVTFKSELNDASLVTVESSAEPAIIYEKANINFLDLTLKRTLDGVNTSITKSDNISFVGSDFTSSLAANNSYAISASENEDLLFSGIFLNNYRNGLLAGTGNGLEVDNSEFNVQEKAIDVNGYQGIDIFSNKFLGLGSVAANTIGLNQITGTSNKLSANEISGYGNGIYVQNTTANLLIDNNTVSSTAGSGVYIESFADSILLVSNTITAGANGGIVRIKDNTTASDILDGLTNKFLYLGGNTLDGGTTGINIFETRKTNILLHNNTFTNLTEGIRISGLLTDLGDNLDIAGNLIRTSGKAIDYVGNSLPGLIRSNTMVSDGTPVQLTDNSNLELCGNIATNLNGGEVVTFAGTNTLTTSWNDWYNYSSNPISNNPSLILSATDKTVDPLFRNVTGGDFTLTTQSELHNAGISCRDTVIHYDVNGKERLVEMDFGAFEAPVSDLNTVPLEIVLEDDLSFTPESTGPYNEFVINGLANFTTVDLQIYDQLGTLVHQSSSKTDFWNGTDANTSALVDEGPYRYTLSLDGKILRGFVYVNRLSGTGF